MSDNTTPEEKSRLARTSVLSMISRSTVFIAPVDRAPYAHGIGSGTILLTAQGAASDPHMPTHPRGLVKLAAPAGLERLPGCCTA
jgi:hypothetical protein